MKCPKCNYISFDYLDSCKKCGKDLSEHKEKHNIRSLLFAGTGAAAGAGIAAVAAADNGEFGFDFNEEEEVATQIDESQVLASDDDLGSEPAADPFGVDEESTDDFSFDSDDSFSFDDDEL